MKKKMIAVLFAILCAVMICAVPSSYAEETEGQEKKDYVIDLSKGYWITFEYDEGLFSFFRKSEDGSMDLDNDGTDDIAIDETFPFANDWTYIFEHVVQVHPLPGGSVNGEVTVKGTDQDAYRSITFRLNNSKVKESYSLKVNGGKATAMIYDAKTKEYQKADASSVAPGTEILLEVNVLSAGQYVSGWQSKDYPFDGRLWDYFIMPAHDVTINAVTAKQKPLTVRFDGENNYGWRGWFEANENDGETYTFNRLFSVTGDAPVDINGDGIADLCVTPVNSTLLIAELPLHSAPKEYVMKQAAVPHYPITIVFSEEPYTIDLSGGAICVDGRFDGRLDSSIEEIIKTLEETLKPYDSADNPGFYDLDRDGTPDIRIVPGECVAVLETYNLGTSFTVPATEYGIKHDLTILYDGELPYHEVTVDAGEGGTAVLYEWAENKSGVYGEEWPYSEPTFWKETEGKETEGKETVCLRADDTDIPFKKAEEGRKLFFDKTALFVIAEPDPGYEVGKIWYEKGGESAEAYGKVISITDDVVIHVSFEAVPTPTPTPTDTPAPTLTPAPTKEAVPTAVPDADEKKTAPKDDENDKEENSLWILCIIIPLAAVLIGGGTFLLLRKRKKAGDTETKSES
ncbi:MAG: hypothetical protein J5845_04725 [Lachnospiraceae bacterium]|nr:hypothetical protein [Lachnospiraceae bacterium]